MGAIAMRSAAAKLLNIPETAERLHISTRTVRRLIDDRALRAFDVSSSRSHGRRNLMISEDEITRFLGTTATFEPSDGTR